MRTISDNSTSSLWWSLLNTAGGFFLFLKSPFRIGDFIELGGKIGSVTKKSFFGSDIETVDGKSVHLDHRYFLFEKLNNLSNQNIIRLDLSINICYSEDMGKVKTDINNFLDTQPSILKSPKPKITVVKLHQNYVELKASPWCSLDDFLEIDHKLENTLTDFLINRSIKMPLFNKTFEEIREIA